MNERPILPAPKTSIFFPSSIYQLIGVQFIVFGYSLHFLSHVLFQVSPAHISAGKSSGYNAPFGCFNQVRVINAHTKLAGQGIDHSPDEIVTCPSGIRIRVV